MSDHPQGTQTYIDEVATRFERAWKKGLRPRIEDYLTDVPEPRRSNLLEELIRGEREIRSELGESPTREEYLRRFPAFTQLVDGIFNAASAPAQATPKGPGDVTISVPPDTGETTPPGEETVDMPRNSTDLPASSSMVPGYEVLGLLGRGGMGVVYKARQLGLNRIIALKMILAGAHAHPEDVERFRIEAEAVARLQHPNIVQIHEVGEHDGLPYFSLEFVEGGSLDRRLDGTPWPAQEAARLVRTLALAIHAAHARGIVHRDLKPANVLLAIDGTPKITDFGLAKRLDIEGRTRSGAIMGTPSYMAPEQAEGLSAHVGPSADVYALGAILYELLTGRPPFKAATPIGTIRKVLNEEPIPPRKLQPGLPRDLETICLSCLQKQEDRRYTSAEALALDLERFLDRRAIQARSVSRFERLWLWCRRNPTLAVMSGATVLMLVGVAVVSGVLTLVATQRDEVAAKLGTVEGARKKVEMQAETLAIDLKQAERNAQTHAASRIEAEAAKTKAVQESRLLSRRRQREAANSELDRGLLMADRGRIKEALHHFVQGLRAAPEDAEDLRALARANLAAWSGRLWTPVAVLPSQQPNGPLDHGPAGTGVSVPSNGLSPDGKVLLMWSIESRADGARSARIRTLTSGHPIGPPLEAVHTARFSLDGQKLMLQDDHSLQVRDTSTGQLVGQPLKLTLALRLGRQDASFSPDGHHALVRLQEPMRFQVWDLTTGKPVGPPLIGVNFFRFSPDGNRLVGWENPGAPRSALLWDVSKGRRLALLPKDIIPIFNADGTRLLTRSGDGFQIWNAVTGKSMGPRRAGRSLPPLTRDPFGSVFFSPDGRRVVSLHKYGTVVAQLWDAVTGRPIGSPMSHGPIGGDGLSQPRITPTDDVQIHSVLFSSNGASFATVSRRQVSLWRAHGADPLLTSGVQQSWIDRVLLSADGTGFLTRDTQGVVRLYRTQEPDNPAVGRSRRFERFPGGPGMALSQRGEMEISPDNARITTKERDMVWLWDAADGQPVGQPIPSRGPRQPVFSPDGRWFATTDGETTWVWDSASGSPDGQPLMLYSGADAAFSSDGRILWTYFGDEHSIRSRKEPCGVAVWAAPVAYSTARRLPPKSVASPGLAKIEEVIFSRDGRSILIRWSAKPALKVWDAMTDRPSDYGWYRGGRILPVTYHEGPVRSAAFSHDGRRVITGGVDGTARLWDPATGRPAGPHMIHDGVVDFVAFSPDGKRIATCTEVISGRRIASVRLWDSATSQPLRQSPNEVNLDTGSRIEAFFSHNSRWLAAVSGNQVRVWSTADGRPALPPTSSARAAFSPDDSRLVTWSGRKVQFWEPSTGRQTMEISPPGERNFGVVLSPDGRRLMTTFDDQTAQLWDVETGRRAGLPMGSEREPLFSSDGRRVLTLNGWHRDDSLKIGEGFRSAVLWDAATGKQVGHPLSHSGSMVKVAFSPDGKLIASCGSDQTARLWRTATGKGIGRPLRHQGVVYCVAFSPDGKLLATSCADGTARVWSTATGRQVGPVLTQAQRVELKPGTLIAAGVLVGHMLTSAHRVESVAPERAFRVEFSPDGRLVSVGYGDGSTRVWDHVSGAMVSRFPRDTPLLFSPDGRFLLDESGGQTVLRDALSWKPIGRPLVGGDPEYLTMSPDGRWFATRESDGVYIRESEIGRPVGPPLPHQGPIEGLTFSDHGSRAVTWDGTTVRAWDATTGESTGPPIRPDTRVRSVIFSPDGSRLGIASDESFRLWEVTTGRPLGATLVHHVGFPDPVLNRDGSRVMSRSGSAIWLWNTTDGRAIGSPLAKGKSIQEVAFSLDGSKIAAVIDGSLRLWYAVTGAPIQVPIDVPTGLRGARFSPDGRKIAVLGSDDSVRLLDANAAYLIGQPLTHRGSPEALSFSPDGRMVATVAEDDVARVWDVATAKPIGAPLFSQGDPIAALAFRRDGRRLAYVARDGTLQTWHLAGSVIGTVERIESWVKVITATELDPSMDRLRPLDPEKWLRERTHLDSLGVPTVP